MTRLPKERHRLKAKFICSLMKYRKSKTGRSASTLSVFHWIVTSTSQVQMQSCCPVSLQHTWVDAMWSLSFIRFPLGNLWSCTVRLRPMRQSGSVFRNICLPAVCLISQISAMQMHPPSNISTIYSTRYSSKTL